MLDWQYAAVLPLFLHAGMPDVISSVEDEVSRTLTKPELPNDFDKLSEGVQESEMKLFRRRLVHYRYIISTTAYNRIHCKGLVYPLNISIAISSIMQVLYGKVRRSSCYMH